MHVTPASAFCNSEISIAPNVKSRSLQHLRVLGNRSGIRTVSPIRKTFAQPIPRRTSITRNPLKLSARSIGDWQHRASPMTAARRFEMQASGDLHRQPRDSRTAGRSRSSCSNSLALVRRDRPTNKVLPSRITSPPSSVAGSRDPLNLRNGASAVRQDLRFAAARLRSHPANHAISSSTIAGSSTNTPSGNSGRPAAR